MSRPDLDYFAGWLSRSLANRGWSNRELARRAGVHESVVGRWLSGRRPSFESAQAVGVALGEDPLRMAATAGYVVNGYERLPMPPPTAERARIEEQMRRIHGLHEEDIAAGLRSWDIRHGIDP